MCHRTNPRATFFFSHGASMLDLGDWLFLGWWMPPFLGIYGFFFSLLPRSWWYFTFWITQYFRHNCLKSFCDLSVEHCASKLLPLVFGLGVSLYELKTAGVSLSFPLVSSLFLFFFFIYLLIYFFKGFTNPSAFLA